MATAPHICLLHILIIHPRLWSTIQSMKWMGAMIASTPSGTTLSASQCQRGEVCEESQHQRCCMQGWQRGKHMGGAPHILRARGWRCKTVNLLRKSLVSKLFESEVQEIHIPCKSLALSSCPHSTIYSRYSVLVGRYSRSLNSTPFPMI